MARVASTGYEHGIVATGVGLLDASLGSPTIQTTIKRTGARALRCNGTAAVPVWARRDFTAHAVVTVTDSFYLDTYDTSTGGNLIVFGLGVAGSECNIKIDQPTGKLVLNFWNGTSDFAGTPEGPVLALDKWYWVQAQIQVGTTSWTVDLKLMDDTGTVTTFTQVVRTGQTATTCGSVFVGSFGGLTADVYHDDTTIWTNTVTDGNYPFSDRLAIVAYQPNGKGTHVLSVGQNYYKDVSATETEITDAGDSDSWTVIDDVPLDADTNHIIVRNRVGGGARVDPGAPSVSSHSGNPTTAPSVTLPTTAAGDLMVAVVTNGGAASAPTFGGTSVTTGGLTWTTIGSGTYSSGGGRVAYAVATGNHSGQTVTATTTDSGSLGVYIWPAANVDPTTPIGANVSSASAGAAANGTLTGFTSTQDNSRICFVNMTDDNQTASAATQNGNSMTAATEVSSTGGADSSLRLFHRLQATAGTTGSFVLTQAAGTASGKWLVAFEVIGKTGDTPPANTDYLEYALPDFGETGTPVGVSAIIGIRNESGTTANSITARLREGGSNGDIFSGNVGSATLSYKRTEFNSKPSGGAWSASTFNSTTFRFGFTDDVDSNPRLESMMVEVTFSVTAGTTISKSGSATSSASGSGSKGIAFPRSGVSTSGSVGSGSRAIRHAKQNTGVSASTGSGARATRHAKTGLGISGSVGSGTGVKVTLVQKSGGATAVARGSGAKALAFPRSGVATSVATGSGSRAVRHAKTGLGQSGSIGSGSRAYSVSRAGLGVSGSVGSGARAIRHSKTNTGISGAIGSGSRATRYARTGVGISAAKGAGEGSTATSSGKTGRAFTAGTGSGSKAVIVVKSGGAISASQGSGAKGIAYPRSGNGITAATGSGSRAVRASKTGVGITHGFGAGAQGGAITYSKSGAGRAVAIGSGSKSAVFAKSVTGISSATGSAARSTRITTSGIGISAAAGSGTKVIAYVKTGVGISAGRGSGNQGSATSFAKSGGATSVATGTGARALRVNRQVVGVSVARGSGSRQTRIVKFVTGISNARGSIKGGLTVVIIGYDETVPIIGAETEDAQLFGSKSTEIKLLGAKGDEPELLKVD